MEAGRAIRPLAPDDRGSIGTANACDVGASSAAANPGKGFLLMGIASISRFVLRHKLLVAVFWVVVAVVGAASASSATGALSQRFDLPGSESTDANLAITRTYGTGGLQ